MLEVRRVAFRLVGGLRFEVGGNKENNIEKFFASHLKRSDSRALLQPNATKRS
jgi:hypothetical protein